MDDVRQNDTDPDRLFCEVLIPRMLWEAGFVVVAIVCRWEGARLPVPQERVRGIFPRLVA